MLRSTTHGAARCGRRGGLSAWRRVMRGCYALAAVSVVAVLGSAQSVLSQERGPLQSFGPEGRLYSSGQDQHFLLSRQSYGAEDSTGYEGQVRIVVKYPTGGYEIKIRNYIVDCTGEANSVAFRDSGQSDTEYPDAHPVTPGKSPTPRQKDAYNLYWATCHGQFRKFK